MQRLCFYAEEVANVTTDPRFDMLPDVTAEEIRMLRPEKAYPPAAKLAMGRGASNSVVSGMNVMVARSALSTGEPRRNCVSNQDVDDDGTVDALVQFRNGSVTLLGTGPINDWHMLV